MRGWWQDLMDLMLPAECAGCGIPRTALCGQCRTALTGGRPHRARPHPEPPGIPVVHAAAPYGDEVRALILAHKERGALGLARPLGTALATAVRAGCHHGENDLLRQERGQEGQRQGLGWRDGDGAEGRGEGEGPHPAPWILVPLPSTPRAVRARGHDAARRLAFAAAGELRRSGTAARVAPVLRQRRPVADQSGLSARERRRNMAGALGVAEGAGRLLSGAGRIVLVDDLMTTGATLAEAARALRVEGTGTGVGAAVIAAPPDSLEINRN
ncbi:ComF family protein [Streptomyces sp. NPDC058045]|uniref:ComF family protein n=1 Tax=Streptomyces sp. NPDC058045 TaxID=3346311 RepID=UPI0036E9DE72